MQPAQEAYNSKRSVQTLRQCLQRGITPLNVYRNPQILDDPINVQLYLKTFHQYAIHGEGISFLFYNSKKGTSSVYDPRRASGIDKIYINYKLKKSPIPLMRNFSDVKNWILLHPGIKGVLLDVRSGYVSKFRTVEPTIGDDLFDKRFDRSKVETDLQHWLYNEIRDLYLENEWDDPSIDQLHGKREELWKRALLLFRLYEQRVTHIEDLPYGVNPTTLPLICKATVNRAIKDIKKVK